MVKPHQRPEFSPSQHAGSQSPSARTREGMGMDRSKAFLAPRDPRGVVCVCVCVCMCFENIPSTFGEEESFPCSETSSLFIHIRTCRAACVRHCTAWRHRHPRRCHGHPKPSAAKRQNQKPTTTLDENSYPELINSVVRRLMEVAGCAWNANLTWGEWEMVLHCFSVNSNITLS